jgi:hypothetical protein
MQKLALATVTTAGVLTAACGGPKSSGVTGPTPVAQAQPPAVNVQVIGTVGGQSVNLGGWAGDVSFNQQTGANRIGLDELRQTGGRSAVGLE